MTPPDPAPILLQILCPCCGALPCVHPSAVEVTQETVVEAEAVEAPSDNLEHGSSCCGHQVL